MPNTQFLPGRLLCMGLLALALAGCAGSGGARPQGAAAANAASSADSLAQTAWELVRWVQPGGAARHSPWRQRRAREAGVPGPGQAIPRQWLRRLQPLHGHLQDRGRQAAHRRAGGHAHGLPTPERAGLEADYLRGLGSIDTFTLDNGGAPRHLTFNLRGGDVLEFVRREDPPTPERPGDQAFQSVFRRRGVRAPCLQCRAAGTGASRRFREIFHVHILQLALARSLRARRRSCRLRIAAARPGRAGSALPARRRVRRVRADQLGPGPLDATRRRLAPDSPSVADLAARHDQLHP